MYCRNCGNEMNQNAVVCVKCGVSKGTGNFYCPHCGKETNPVAAVCLSCGCSLANTNASENAKSKLVAGLLGIFLGGLGIHDLPWKYPKSHYPHSACNSRGSRLRGAGHFWDLGPGRWYFYSYRKNFC